MDAAQLDECVARIAERRPDLTRFSNAEVCVKWDECLGEGGFCTAYRAEWNGRDVCARVVDTDRVSTAVSEVATVEGLPAIAARVYGYTTEHRPPSADEEAADDDAADDAAKKDSCVKRHRGCLAVITELCPHGNLEDFMVAEGAPLSPAVKLDVMLQVAEGLERLKSARVVWRDLKAKNLLVRDAKRGRTGEVVKLTVAFTDWGTAVKLPEEGKRRMTLHGPGTAGYIAPDTRGPTYDYGADMWAFLVWAASMCLRVECVVDCQLEEAIAELKLEKKLAATAGHEEKVDGVLRAFEADGKIEDGCEATYELLRTAAPWVDAALRWTTEEAVEELTAFRGDHGLVIDVSAVQERRCSTLHAARPAPPPREELPSASIDQDAMDAPATTTRRLGLAAESLRGRSAGVGLVAPTPGRRVNGADVDVDDDDDVDDEDPAVRAVKGGTAPAPAPTPRAPDPYDFDASFGDDADVTGTDLEVDEDDDVDDDVDVDDYMDEEDADVEDDVDADEDPYDSEEEIDANAARAAANAAAAKVAGAWTGKRVRKWFALVGDDTPSPPPRKRGRGRPAAKKKNQRRRGDWYEGVVVETRAVKNYDLGAYETCAFVRYDDGDEEDLVLSECAKWLVDDDAATREGGGGGARTAAAKKGKKKSKTEKKPTSAAGSRRAALGSLSSNDVAARNAATTHQKRYPWEEDQDNDQDQDDAQENTPKTPAAKAKSRLGAAADYATAAKAVVKSLSAQKNARATRGGKRTTNTGVVLPSTYCGKGRTPPLFAINAVELDGIELGCSKCRYARYGCLVCRAKAGVTETLALPAPGAGGRDADAGAGAGAGGKRKAAAAPAAAATSKRPKTSAAARAPKTPKTPKSTRKLKPSSRTRGGAAKSKALRVSPPKSAGSGFKSKAAPSESLAVALALFQVDVAGVRTKEDLASRLPHGVELGCSKCRHGWRGCGACRERAGVWLPPAASWVRRYEGYHHREGEEARFADASIASGALALPAPGDAPVRA